MSNDAQSPATPVGPGANGERVVWELPAVPRSVVPRLAACALLAAGGLVLAFSPSALSDIVYLPMSRPMLPGLVVTAFSLVLGAVFYRYRPAVISYQLTDHALRIVIRGKLAIRVARGELRYVRRRWLRRITWARTAGFSGNPTGFTQFGRDHLFAVPDTAQVFRRLAAWTAGDEVAAESAATAFVADPQRRGRTIGERRSCVTLSVPEGWPVESRRLTRERLRILGRALPLGTVRRGELRLLGQSTADWDAIRVRASERVGFYLEISDRTSDRDMREVRARWPKVGSAASESGPIPIPGFRGVMIEQPIPGPAAVPPLAEGRREWVVDGCEDEGFGMVRNGGTRLLLWATDGQVAIHVRAYASASRAASARAIMAMLRSIHRP